MRKLLLPLLASLLLQGALQAQKLPERELSKEGVVRFQRFGDDNLRQLSQSKIVLKELLLMSSADSMGLQKTITENGREHQLYQQYYKGYKVHDATYALHAKYGVIETANGFFSRIGNIRTDISVDKQAALATALNYIHAGKYGWEDPFSENTYKTQVKDPGATLYPSAELLIYHDDSISHAYRLVYKFHIYAVQPFSDNNIYVDAITGKVVGRENLTRMDNTNGNGATLYSGGQSITMDSYNTPVLYRLRETRTGPAGTAQIQTMNMQNGGVFGNAVDFSSASTNWTTDAGLDVHWGTEKVFDYWNTIRGRNSFNGTGGTLLSYVHANLVDMGRPNNDNAFWSPTLLAMTYADGTTAFKSVTSLDVIAHEIGHAICQFTAGLGFAGESPSLNEGLSDIWGAVIENYAASWKQPWKIGEDIMKNGKPCLRSLQNPNTGGDPGGSTTGGFPDTYNGTFWDNGLEPHTNATVLGHWFYLLSQGGGGTNDLGNAFTVTGIGIEQAAAIVWNAESTMKLQPASQYTDARTAMINAAVELFGACSGQVVQVTNAWYAVGIGAAIPVNSSYTITGTTPVCSSQPYTINNLPGGSTIAWNTRQPYPQAASLTFSPVNGNPTTVTFAAGPGVTVPVYASLIVPGTGCVSTPVRWIHLGEPSSVEMTNLSPVPYPYYGVTGIVVTDAPPPYYWYVDNVLKKTTTTTSSGIVTAPPCGVMHSFQVGVSNGCPPGIIKSLTYHFSNKCGMRVATEADSTGVDGTSVATSYILSPNPAGAATVHIAQADNSAPGIQQVKIYTVGGIAVKWIRYGPDTRQSDIGISDLKPGLYFVEIFDGAKYERKKLVVQH